MSKITIDNLYPAGSDLFMDSEGFMDDLSEAELSMNHGGSIISIAAAISNVACATGALAVIAVGAVGVAVYTAVR